MKLIACDVDGTLLAEGRTPPVRTLRAIERWVAGGNAFLPVTGRHARIVPHVPVEHLLDGTMITSGGAALLDTRTGTSAALRDLEPANLVGLLDFLRVVLPGGDFAVETLETVHYEPRFLALKSPRTRRWASVLQSPKDFVAGGEQVLKLLYHHPGFNADQMVNVITDRFELPLCVTHASKTAGIVEFSHVYATKLEALKHVATAYGVDAEDVIAFGDMPNDVGMLDWAGLGIAMADAHPLARAEADMLAPSVELEGVAVIVEQLLDASHGSRMPMKRTKR